MKLIKYHNDINKLKLGNFTENETDIFFSLLFKAKETKADIIIMDFLELKSLANGDKNKDRFLRNILGLNTKLKAMSQTIEVEKGVFDTFSLFGTIRTDTNEELIKVPIERNFRYLIDDIMNNFTVIDLKQLVSLKGNYPKVLYRLLKQFETTKLYTVKINDFRELMGIPSTYAMFNIRQKVLKPSMEQLNKYFEGLNLEEIKIGRNVSSLKFTWNKKEKKVKKVNIMPINKRVVLGENELKEYEDEKSKQKEYEEIEKKILIRESDQYNKMYEDFLNKNKSLDTPLMRKAFDISMYNKYKIIEG